MLLDKYYIEERPLPADLKAVQRLIGARTDEERQTVEIILKEYFELTDDGWRSSKCDEVISAAQARIEVARTNGKRGGRPKSNPEETQRKPSGLDMGLQNETQTKAYQSPSTKHQAPVEDVDDARAKLDRLDGDLRDAAGAALDPTSTGLMVLDRPLAWAEAGCDFEQDVLPAIRAAAARASPGSIRSWKYFDQAVADAKARRLAPMPEGRANERNHAQSRDADARSNHLAGIAAAVAAARG